MLTTMLLLHRLCVGGIWDSLSTVAETATASSPVQSEAVMTRDTNHLSDLAFVTQHCHDTIVLLK